VTRMQNFQRISYRYRLSSHNNHIYDKNFPKLLFFNQKAGHFVGVIASWTEWVKK